MSEAARKEREHIEQRILAEKNAMQLKLKQNLLAKKQTQTTNKYTFEMLCTDDETDDEDKHKNPNRPKPPQWSLRTQRPLII